MESIRKYLAELIGTFTLVLVGTSVAVLQGFLGMGPAGWLGISFAFGFTLLVLVLVIGPVSGCHVNPAVSVPMALSGRLPMKLLPGYVIAQCVGAALASLVLMLLMSGVPDYTVAEHGLGANGNPQGLTVGALFGWELVITALFLMTIFAATRDDAPAIAAPLAIGGFLFVAHLIGAPLGDSSLNPARSLGPAIFQGGEALSVLWIFIVSPLIGGGVGWILYKVLYAD